jgi:hypothetical protein
MRGFFKESPHYSLQTMENIRIELQKISFWIKETNRVTFIFIITSVLILITLLFIYTYGFIGARDLIWLDFPGKKNGLIETFFLAVILAPLFETWFNQSLPFKLLQKVNYLKERTYLILLISALFFGITHFYSLFYIIYATLMGFVLMYGYMVRIKTDNRTFYLIAICHSIVNLGVFVKNFLIG